jgi:hypothetical protein
MTRAAFMDRLMAPDPVINVPLLRKVLEHVTAHPEEWEQGQWGIQVDTACGSAHCVAGHAAMMAGAKPVWNVHARTMENVTIPETGEAKSVFRYAAEVLGLSDAQGMRMFDAFNTLPKLWQFAVDYTKGEITMPEEITRLVEA